MMSVKNLNRFAIGITILSSAMLSIDAFAAACKIKYQYSFNANNKKVVTLLLNSGQTKTVNQSRIDYVKNLQQKEVKIFLRNNLTNVNYSATLKKNNVDPALGYNLINVKLKSVKCIAANSATTIDKVIGQLKKQVKHQVK